MLPPVPAADLDHILTLAEAELRELAGQRLFITGGTGFFGTWLLESIAAANARLGTGIRATVLSRDPEAFARRSPHLAANRDFDWLAGDIRGFVFPDGRFDVIIHAATAASATLNTSAPREMLETIVHGTERALEFADRAGARRLLLTSSGAVYGPQPPSLDAIPEDYPGGPDPVSPISAYAEGKRMAELLCVQANHVETKIARCFAFVGPHLPLDAHFAVGNFLRDAIAGRAILVRGDGTPFRSYLYAADLVVWLLAILIRGTPGRPYNVGSDEAVSISALAGKIAHLNSPAANVRICQAEGMGPSAYYVPAVNRACEELELAIGIRLNDALVRTFYWLKRAA